MTMYCHHTAITCPGFFLAPAPRSPQQTLAAAAPGLPTRPRLRSRAVGSPWPETAGESIAWEFDVSAERTGVMSLTM